VPLVLSRTTVNHKVGREPTQPSRHSEPPRPSPSPTEQEATSKSANVDTILFQASSTIVAEGLASSSKTSKLFRTPIINSNAATLAKTAHAPLQKSGSCISVSYSTPALNQAGVSVHHLAYDKDQPVHTNRNALITMQTGHRPLQRCRIYPLRLNIRNGNHGVEGSSGSVVLANHKAVYQSQS
jgi:hypothetical protein